MSEEVGGWCVLLFFLQVSCLEIYFDAEGGMDANR